jgi:uncharacterized protein YlxW (UPF0749 family)
MRINFCAAVLIAGVSFASCDRSGVRESTDRIGTDIVNSTSEVNEDNFQQERSDFENRLEQQVDALEEKIETYKKSLAEAGAEEKTELAELEEQLNALEDFVDDANEMSLKEWSVFTAEVTKRFDTIKNSFEEMKK